MKARPIFLETETRRIVANRSGAPISAPIFFGEDVETVELYFLEDGKFADYSANTIKFAVGTTTPAAFQLTWSAISTGVTIGVTTLVNGGAGSNEVQQLSFSKAPTSGGFAIVLPSRNVTVSSVSASVFTAANHGLFDQQTVSITGFSFTGSSVANGGSYFIINRTNDTFSLAATAAATTGLTAVVTSGGGTVTLPEITTPAIAYDAPPSEVAQAIANAGLQINGAGQVAVSGVKGQEYTLAFGGGCQRIDYPEVTVTANTLAAAPGMTANVNFNTTAISDLIDAGTTAVTMEVEVSNGTNRHTYQTAALLSGEIISSSAPITSIVNATTNFTLNSGDGSTWNITIDNNGSLTASKI